MGRQRKLQPECVVCGSELRPDRVPPYCSKKCQLDREGYARNSWPIEEKDAVSLLEKIKAQIEGSTAWRPIPLDPVEHVISTKPIAVFSDLHAPIHSKEWLLHGIACSMKVGAEICILNGDVLDLNEISRHHGSYYRRRKDMGDDLDAGEAVFKILCANFKKVYWLSGNHCIERLLKLFGGELNAQRVSKLIGSYDNLKVTSRSFLDVNDNVRLCHPRQYSRIRGALAQRLAMRWQKHVGTGHQHHAAMTFSTDGKFQAVDIPCMADTDCQDYVRNELNDFPEPMQGFGMIFGDSIQVFTKYTPWELFGLPRFEGKK